MPANYRAQREITFGDKESRIGKKPTGFGWIDQPKPVDDLVALQCAWRRLLPHAEELVARWIGDHMRVRRTGDFAPSAGWRRRAFQRATGPVNDDGISGAADLEIESNRDFTGRRATQRGNFQIGHAAVANLNAADVQGLQIAIFISQQERRRSQ